MRGISLRPVEDADLEIFFAQQADDGARQCAQFPGRPRAEFMAHWQKIRADANCLLRAIISDGAIAGNVVSWQAQGARNIGYWLGREFWGRGIATSAVKLFVSESADRPLLGRAAKTNAGSIRVLEKCGFQKIGHAKFIGLDGEEAEEIVMRLL